MRIAVLILERERRLKERGVAKARVEAVERRLSEIDAEERALREWLDRARERPEARGGEGAPSGGTGKGPARGVRRLRY